MEKTTEQEEAGAALVALLIRGKAPGKLQMRFNAEVARSLNAEDSAAGDREIREAVAESFAARYVSSL